MRRAIPLLLLLSSCAAPHGRATAVEPRVIAVREAAIEVVNATGRELPAPRPGLYDEIARATGGPASPFSTADAFVAAAAIELRRKGISAVAERSANVPLLRVTLLDFEIRNQDAAGAVAFVSTKYLLLDAKQQSLWEAAEKHLPVRLGGPDLTRSALARIAAEVVSRGLSSFPVATQP